MHLGRLGSAFAFTLAVLFLGLATCMVFLVPAAIPALMAEATPTPSPVISPPATPTLNPIRINVTKADYDEALARWRSQGIDSYVITVSLRYFSPATGVYTVLVNGDTVDLVRYEPRYGGGGGNSLDPNHMPENYEDRFTVATLFANVEKVVNNPIADDSDSASVNYIVHFDKTLGYPASIVTERRHNVTDIGGSTTVSGLKILSVWGSPVPHPTEPAQPAAHPQTVTNP